MCYKRVLPHLLSRPILSIRQAMADVLPFLNVRHGRRLAIAVNQVRAGTEPDSPWVPSQIALSLPFD